MAGQARTPKPPKPVKDSECVGCPLFDEGRCSYLALLQEVHEQQGHKSRVFVRHCPEKIGHFRRLEYEAQLAASPPSESEDIEPDPDENDPAWLDYHLAHMDGDDTPTTSSQESAS